MDRFSDLFGDRRGSDRAPTPPWRHALRELPGSVGHIADWLDDCAAAGSTRLRIVYWQGERGGPWRMFAERLDDPADVRELDITRAHYEAIMLLWPRDERDADDRLAGPPQGSIAMPRVPNQRRDAPRGTDDDALAAMDAFLAEPVHTVARPSHFDESAAGLSLSEDVWSCRYGARSVPSAPVTSGDKPE